MSSFKTAACLAALMGVACTDASSSACPPAPLLEDLHAAAFYFQHGPHEKGRVALERARQALGKSNADATARARLEDLESIAAKLDTDPNGAASATEYVRIAFGDWACLTPTLHKEFHTRLPVIPGDPAAP